MPSSRSVHQGNHLLHQIVKDGIHLGISEDYNSYIILELNTNYYTSYSPYDVY